jgi:pimeloyl-ACP methyl ester carboxylesterase
MKTIKTELLEIAYFDDGPTNGQTILLLHGWPDDPYGMRPVSELLNKRGFRTIVPWLRGFGPTRFLHKEAFRDGRGVALAHDAFDLLSALDVDRFFIVGHDWGARAAYNIAAIAPERLLGVVGLGLPYTPNGKFEVPAFDQSRLWWYQWFMMTDGGAEKVRQDPVGFARIQWETWSPTGWFEDWDFDRTSESFLNPDWPAITLHAYRSRWKEEPVDPRYRHDQATIERTSQLAVPTRAIVGCEDRADDPHDLTDEERILGRDYMLRTLKGVGHFPAREAPETVADIVQAMFDERTIREERDDDATTLG